MSYLFRHPKTSIYWFRRGVPAGLRPIVGRTEFKRSLGTTDVREAKRLALTVAAEVDGLFAAAGRTASESSAARRAVDLAAPDGVEVAVGSSAPVSVVQRPACLPDGFVPGSGDPSESECGSVRIAPALIDAAVVACCRTQVEGWRRDEAEPWRVGPTPIEAAIESQQQSLAVWYFAVAHRDWSIADPLIDDALKVTGRRRSDASRGDIAALARALTFGMIRLTEYRIAELEARLPQAPGPLATATAITCAATNSAIQSDVTLMELLELYDRERRYEKRLRQEITTIVRRFGEVAGPDLPVRRLTVKHASDYKAARLSMPFKLSHARRKLTLPQIVAAGDSEAEERVSPTTVAKDLNLLRGLAAWGVREGYLATNPFEGIAVHVAEADKLQRDNFTEQDLAILFGSPLYNGCRSATDRSTAGTLIIRDAHYWLPLLGLYQGARLEELGQMLGSDVRSETVRFADGREEKVAVLYIDTRDEREQGGPRRRRGRDEVDPSKRLKTRSSKRRVPVHPILLRLGFLDYVAAAKAAGHARIHHTLKVDGYGRTTKIWSQWFGRYLTSIGLSRPELTFHSTRHTFKTACRRAHIPRDVSHALSGHSSSDVGDGYGEYPLETLATELRKLSYPAVEKALGLT